MSTPLCSWLVLNLHGAVEAAIGEVKGAKVLGGVTKVVCVARRTRYSFILVQAIFAWIAHCGALNPEQDKLRPHGFSMTCSDDLQRFSQLSSPRPQVETPRPESQSDTQARATWTAMPMSGAWHGDNGEPDARSASSILLGPADAR